jgi:two-component system, chemotaxis family, sensor kinase CheA
MDELLGEFLTETNESLATLDLELVKLEQNPNDPALLNNIFRLVHTIKGTCGFLGLPRLEHVAHAGENVLGKARDGELNVTPEAVSLILAALDRIKWILSALEQTEAEPAGDDADLIDRLNAMAEGRLVAAPKPAPVAAAAPPVEAKPAPTAAAEEEPAPGTGDPVDALEAAWNSTPFPEITPQAEVKHDPVAAAEPMAPMAESQIANQSIRVSVDLLENLMTTVSELVLTRNQLLQMVRGRSDSQFNVPLQRLSQVTSELQESVMKTRMQPIGNAWAKLPRIIRDLGHELGKKIDLQMVGADTELDRQVLELIKDPLTHMVRNSADHGLEGTAERVKAGKPETGRVVLNAYHEGGHIVIQITDDGRGLNLKRIREKAVAKGLAGEAEVAAMSDAQVAQFIFKAGFSTAAQVTSVSGRGVGMDVVRTNIEKIGGTIDLKTKEGKGTSFTIKIPLTLAIVSALIVECKGERFAIPQISVVELVRASNDSEHKIETINRTPVLRLRNRLLPLVHLSRVLKLDGGEQIDTSEAFVVVTQVGAYTFGIVVDRVFDTEEIVVKPVSPLMRDVPIFSGNTILGDGSVIMILDPNGIAAATGDHAAEQGQAEETEAARRSTGDDKTSLLVFRAGGTEPKAVPLSLVARLEDIPVDTVETSNGQSMVQYRGRLMPLVKLNESYDFRAEGRQPVLVFAEGERSMGLVVDEIVDIVEDKLTMEIASDRPGVLGSAIVAGKATELIDVGFYLTQGSGGSWFRTRTDGFGNNTNAKRVLLVDDSPFFRNMLTPLLSVAGYEVTAAATADEALKLKDSGEDFDVIVSDIEMPGMNGFQFAEAVRKDSRWSATPIVALSSYAGNRDFDRGRAAGFSDYVAKFDRDALLSILSQTVALKEDAA